MRFLRRIIQGTMKIFFVIGLFINGRYKFISNNIKVPKEPVLFLSNHQLNLDAVRLRVYNSRRILFVGHEEVFRNKLYKTLATNVFDIICRGNSKNDISYIKDLFRAKKQGLSIGIYPEGGINYFNKSIKFDISIAKLAKKLNMPILLCRENGGSFVKPRWAKHKGKNKVEYSYMRLINKDELKTLSIEELYKIILDNICIDDYDWQKTKLSPVNRKKPVKNLNRALFVCPKCYCTHTLNFTDNLITCNHCKKSFGLDKYDFVTNSSKIKTLVEWDKLQYKKLNQKLKSVNEKQILLQTNAFFQKTSTYKYFNKSDKKEATITLYKNNLIVEFENQKLNFPTVDLYKIYVEFINTLQFNYLDEKIRIDSVNLPAYIWVTYLRCLSSKYLITDTNIECIDNNE